MRRLQVLLFPHRTGQFEVQDTLATNSRGSSWKCASRKSLISPMWSNRSRFRIVHRGTNGEIFGKWLFSRLPISILVKPDVFGIVSMPFIVPEKHGFVENFSPACMRAILCGMTIREEKASLRRVMRERLLSFGVDERQVGSEALAANVAASDAYRTCTAVLAFSSHSQASPTCASCWTAPITEGKRVGLPVCRSDGTLRFHEVGPAWQEHMMKNRWGIAEPDPVSCPPVQLDGQGSSLVLVSCLAFSPRCGRLGRGKGFYDRFLAGKPAG